MFTECLLYARHCAGHLGHSGEWDLSFSLQPISHQVPSHSLMSVKVTQSCLTLCDPMEYIVHGILQARILEWVAFPFSRGIFPTQGLNPGLPHCRWTLYQGKPSFPKFLLNLSPPPCFLSLGWWPCFSYLGNWFSLLTGLTPFNVPV